MLATYKHSRRQSTGPGRMDAPSASCFLSRISGWRDRRLYPLAGGSRGGAANPVRALAGAGGVIFYDWVGAGGAVELPGRSAPAPGGVDLRWGGPRVPFLSPTRAREALMMAGAGGAMRATGWRATAIRFQQFGEGGPACTISLTHSRARGADDGGRRRRDASYGVARDSHPVSTIR